MSNPEIGRTVQAGDISTNYHDSGNGGRAVVLLHGSGPGVSAWANWRLNIGALGARLRTVAPDMVGFGYSDKPPGFSYTLESWLHHLEDFLDALDLRRVSLVGNSFGGAVALRYAVVHPDRVERLVLMGSVGVEFELTPGLDAVWGYEPSVDAMRELLDLFAYDQDLVGDDLARLRYEASIQPGVQEAFSAMFPSPRQRWISALATDLRDVAQLPHETLIVHGREDRVIPTSTSLELFAAIRAAELHMFGRCGHWTQIEHRDRFNTLVASFLDRA